MESKRQIMTQPEDWLKAFSTEAKKQRLSLSAWIGECCVKELPLEVQAKLSQRPAAHRPGKSNA